MKFLRRLANEFTENIRIALEQLWVHKMRSLLTALGVIIGVWAVILMGIAINGINTGFANSMDMLGSDHFYVERFPWRDVGDDWRFYRNRPEIKAQLAADLNEIIARTPDSKLTVAVPTVNVGRTVWRDDRQIPNVFLFGTTADYQFIDTNDLAHGRFFTEAEYLSRQNVCVLGAEVAEALFPEGVERALGEEVSIAGIKFTILGVYEKQGSFLGLMSFDRNVAMPLSSMRKFFLGHRWRDSTSIRVVKKPDVSREAAVDEIIGAMRQARALLPEKENDFEINSSESIEGTLGPVKAGLAIAGFVITSLALGVGAVGIMNITFVSVKERTKEIGTRRAIGARQGSILLQFLTESVSICLVGGVFGLAFAYACQLAREQFLPDFPTSLSPPLVLLAFAVSVATGIAAGFIPALMASRLDPANALRHE
ncbi:MAG: ABC transporter permease [Opitutales bacterium]